MGNIHVYIKILEKVNPFRTKEHRVISRNLLRQPHRQAEKGVDLIQMKKLTVLP